VPRPSRRRRRPTLPRVSEYGDPDLETIAPLPPIAPDSGAGTPPPPPRSGRGPAAAVVAALVVVSLVIGFGVATVVLNARDKSSDNASATPVIPIPVTPSPTLTPGSTLFPVVPGTTPGSTTPGTTLPPDPDDGALTGLILHQADVHTTDSVALLPNGADLTVATLDLCNGTFPSEAQRTARRQVAQVTAQSEVVLSTEAILYRAPATGTQAFRELKAVAANCPSSPVISPVGEDTATTTFHAAPDRSWPRTASVDRLAFDFTTVDATTGDSSHSIAVYLRRGRALMGVYFDQPDGAQDAVAGQTTVAGIVGVFEARMAKLPANVVNG
jgi:hypothetical protein